MRTSRIHPNNLVWLRRFHENPEVTHAVVQTRGSTLPANAGSDILVFFVGTLDQCARERKLSGDLIAKLSDRSIDQSDTWLFDWEKITRRIKASYAIRMQQDDAKRIVAG